MDNTILTVITAIVAGLVLVVTSIIVTYFTTRSQARLDLIAEYDKELRTNRLKAYQALWKLTEPLARYTRPDPVTYQVINNMTMKMRIWYFHEGGMFLTANSRNRYFELKASMESLVKGLKTDQNVMQENDEYFALLKQKSMANPDVEIEDENYVKFLVRQGSALRTALATDVGTRNISFVSKKAKGQQPIAEA